jgi:hypothetical protein
MKIQTGDTDVGQFYVLGINMQNGDAHIARYWKDYKRALNDAQETWHTNRDKGFIYLVLEVQGKVASQGVPELTTKLTEKL